MSGKSAKKYRKAMREQAEKDSKQLQTFLANKSFKYRFKLAMKILFKRRKKK